MADVVYLLGAGFNLSLMDDHWRQPPPLARNFFQVLLGPGHFKDRLDGVRRRIYVDQLFEEIKRYWHLTLDDLATTPFDIEECLTFLQALSQDVSTEERRLDLDRAAYALRNLLLMYLGELTPAATSPTALRFGNDILSQSADVLTLNYDTIAEGCVELGSGVSAKPMPDSLRGAEPGLEIPDEDLDASHFNWNPARAYGFQFR